MSQVTVSSLVGASDTRRIDIYGGGLIRMCDPAVSAADDPRRC
jgi:type IV fimbrial biogenesis protein FimT